MINPILERELHLQLENLLPPAQKQVLEFARGLATGTLSDEEAQEKIDASRKIAAR